MGTIATRPTMEDDTLIPVIDVLEEPTATYAFVPLTFEQARVLGCLVEKEITTPDVYPLTLNALTTACNQSTNRDPVVGFTENVVQEAIDGLKARQFAFQVTISGARVQKFKHNLFGKIPRLQKREVALLCVLLLRGAQTIGELRQRTERLYNFPDLPSVEAALQSLMSTEHGDALVVCFPPGHGRKSAVYLHTLCGATETAPSMTTAKTEVISFAPAAAAKEDDLLWRARIEGELQALRDELRSLKEKLGEA